MQDDKITQEEWLKMWQDCIKASGNTSDLPEWQQRYMDFMFEVNDTSGRPSTIIHHCGERKDIFDKVMMANNYGEGATKNCGSETFFLCPLRPPPPPPKKKKKKKRRGKLVRAPPLPPSFMVETFCALSPSMWLKRLIVLL